MKNTFSVLILVLILLTSCGKTSNDWTKWRGQNGDGVSNDKELDVSKLDSSHILWKRNIGFGHSSIIVRGQNCYVTGWKEKLSGKDSIGEGSIYCLDVTTGKEVWSYNYLSDSRSFPGPRSTPIIDGNNLYAISWQGKLFCLDVGSGRELWQVDLIADSVALQGNWGICPSPVIYENLILLNLNKTGLAIDKISGKVVWNSELKNAHYSTVKLIKYQHKIVGVFMCDTLINLVDPTNGKVLVTYDKDSNKSMENDAMVTSDGNLFTSDELIMINDKSLHSVWKNDTISSYFRVGVIKGDYAYQFSDNKNKGPLVCVNVKSGEPSWSAQLGRFGALTVAGDKLIIITGLGKLMIVDAKPDRFNLLKELQVLSQEEIEKNWCWTAPTFSGGKLFVRNSGGEMACVDLSF